MSGDSKELEGAMKQSEWLIRRLKQKEKFRDNCQVKKTILSGSVARGTCIRPLHDIDMIAIMGQAVPESYFYDILRGLSIGASSVERVENEEKEGKVCYHIIFDSPIEGVTEMTIRKQEVSLGVCFGFPWSDKGATFDIVPASRDEEGNLHLRSPKAKQQDVATNPPKVKEAIEKCDIETNGER